MKLLVILEGAVHQNLLNWNWMLHHGDLSLRLDGPEAIEEMPRLNEQKALKTPMALEAIKAMEAIVAERLDGFQVVEEAHWVAFAFAYYGILF
jgi:hypothetical protein